MTQQDNGGVAITIDWDYIRKNWKGDVPFDMVFGIGIKECKELSEFYEKKAKEINDRLEAKIADALLAARSAK